MPYLVCDVKPTLETKPVPKEVKTEPSDQPGDYCQQYAVTLSSAASIVSYVCSSFQSFQNHGFCEKGSKCPLSHDLDVILDCQGYKYGVNVPKKRKREEDTLNNEATAHQMYRNREFHSAHYDSFMTGYLFAHQLVALGRKEDPLPYQEIESIFLKQHGNKVYMMHKNFPLLIEKSLYVSNSKYFKEKSEKK
jgi:hypothetical protein